MTQAADRGAQETPLYRMVSRISGPPAPAVAPLRHRAARLLLAILGGGWIAAATALGGPTWLLPALAPSLFLLATVPLAPQSAPRALIPAHAAAVVLGLLASRWAPPMTASALAAAATGLLLVATRTPHAPAVATAALAGWMLPDVSWSEGAGTAALLIGVITGLALLAWVLLRCLAGIRYPLWRTDPTAWRDHADLAGVSDPPTGFWHRLQSQILARR